MSGKESKMSIEEINNMSLDEYIAVSNDHGKDDELLPDLSSQQWRLKYPFRSAGMPPLVSTKAPKKRFRRNQWYDRDSPSVGVNKRNNQTQSHFKAKRYMFDDATQSHVFMTASGMIPQKMTNENSTSLVPFSHSDTLGTLATIGSQMFSPSGYMNMAKALIEKMAEVQQSRVNIPKYDMSLQKEISDIQGKTLYFTCGSDEPQKVISFDGVGIEDCQFKINTTKETLNQRFSKC